MQRSKDTRERELDTQINEIERSSKELQELTTDTMSKLVEGLFNR